MKTETALLEKQTQQRGKKEKYEKPLIEKVEKMTFPLDIIVSANNGKRVCKQCSSCHSCR